MAVMVTKPIAQWQALLEQALLAHNTSASNAAATARALCAAQADGLGGHGFSRLPAYVAQARSGKVDGHAKPALEWVARASARIDAANGFAFPALNTATDALIERTQKHGISAAAIYRSHHCGACAHHVERLADAGLIGLMFSNSPQAIAPWGGSAPVFGTNPIAFAAPRRQKPPLLIDLSLSKVARGKVMVAAQQNKPIPEGWALDKNGQPTRDAQAALEGTMLPMGDAKGAALVLMVEVLAAALTQSHFGFEAGSFFTADGAPPGVGQFILAIDPGPLSANSFADRLELLLAAIDQQDGTRIPGERRMAIRREAEQHGLSVDEAMHASIVALAGNDAASVLVG